MSKRRPKQEPQSTAPVRIEAPWTPEQVKSLNAFQRANLAPAFACGNRHLLEHTYDQEILIATERGWICGHARCDYTQAWALLSMADGTWMEELSFDLVYGADDLSA